MFLALLAALLAAASAPAAPADDVWITLGTQGGPIAGRTRFQPANALVHGRQVVLVDAGDGAVDQLARAGLRLPQVSTLFLSHLHWDHTAGLQAVLGLRYQTDVPGVLTIYGPPGTRALVDGLVASMAPGAAAGDGIPGQPHRNPADTVRVVEVAGGSVVKLGDLTVTAAQNTHYSFTPGSPQDKAYKSLAYRFAMPGRTITYTGDTGPSPAVLTLARGSDLLVSEVIDVPATVANVRRNTPDITAAALEGLERHLSTHHLTARQVGELAAAAGVKEVVLTHIVPGNGGPAANAAFEEGVRSVFHGPVEVAADLDRF